MATDKIFDLEVFDVDDTGKCTAEGGFVGNLIGGVTGVETTYTSDGAISLDDAVSILDGSSFTVDMELADGTFVGQEMVIACVSSLNSATVTLENAIFISTDVVTFDVGDMALIRWTSSGWGVVQGIVVS